jgi:recombinational DNA repair protein (RecF pathway)
MAIIKTEAVVLKHSIYREKSKLVTLLTRSHGKIRCIAKGVRDTKSKWGGVLESMAYLNVIFYFKENRTLHLLSSAEYAKAFTAIYDDFEKMKIGFRILEMTDRISIEGHLNTELFEALLQVLENLDTATKNYVNLLFNFEFKAAKLLGFGIELDTMNKLNLDYPKENRVNKRQNNYYVQDETISNYGASNLIAKDSTMLSSGSNSGNLNILSSGNIRDILELKLSKTAETAIDNFINEHFKSHFEDFEYSRAKKIIYS